MEHSLLTGTDLFGILSVTAQILLCTAELFNSVLEVYCGFICFCEYFVSLGAFGLQQQLSCLCVVWNCTES